MVRAKGLILIVAATLAVTHAAAQSEKKNDVGVVVGYIAPSSDSTIAGFKTEAQSTVDYGITYKHRFLESNRLSVGGTLLFAPLDVEAAGTEIGSIDYIPLLIDANWHFLAKKNLYAGVTAGYAMWGDFEPNDNSGNVNVKKNVVFGVNVGYDIPIGERWAILTNLRWLSQEAETDESGVQNQTINVDPIIANVGFAFRF